MKDGSKANLLIDSLSSDSDNGIPDLELVPPNRQKKKQRFKKMTSKLNLPKVSVTRENVLPRMHSWCLSLLLCSLVVGLGVTAWYTVSLHRSVQDFMRNTSDTIAHLQERVKLLESSQPLLPIIASQPKSSPPVPVVDTSQITDLQKSNTQLQVEVAKLQSGFEGLNTITSEMQSNLNQLTKNLSASVIDGKVLLTRIDHISDQLSTTVISSLQFILDCLNRTTGDTCSSDARRDQLITSLSSMRNEGFVATSPNTGLTTSNPLGTTLLRRRTLPTSTTPVSDHTGSRP